MWSRLSKVTIYAELYNGPANLFKEISEDLTIVQEDGYPLYVSE